MSKLAFGLPEKDSEQPRRLRPRGTTFMKQVHQSEESDKQLIWEQAQKKTALTALKVRILHVLHPVNRNREKVEKN
jgi:hypothetical protein